MSIPVLLVTFNRLDYTKEVFASIATYKPKKLYIASDGPRPDKEGEKEKVEDVRQYLMSHITWNCDVKTRFLETNSGGCGLGVSGAVTWFFENEENGIILEDDCVASISFFDFCEKMLDKYKDDKDVYSIVGYNPAGVMNSLYDYEFASISHCWGWATWKDRWQCFKFKFEPEEIKIAENFSSRLEIQEYWKNIFKIMNDVNIWDYQWNFCIAKHKGLTIYPVKNLISNIGEVGVHYTDGAKELNLKTYELYVQKYNDTKSVEKMNNVLWDKFFNIGAPKNKFTQKVYLFHFLPLYKIKKKGNKSKHYLFGFIPLFKIKEK